MFGVVPWERKKRKKRNRRKIPGLFPVVPSFPSVPQSRLPVDTVCFDHNFRRHFFAGDRKRDEISARIERRADHAAETPTAAAATAAAAAESSLLLSLTGLRLSRLSLSCRRLGFRVIAWRARSRSGGTYRIGP